MVPENNAFLAIARSDAHCLSKLMHEGSSQSSVPVGQDIRKPDVFHDDVPLPVETITVDLVTAEVGPACYTN